MKINKEKKKQDQNETRPKDLKSLVNEKNESKASAIKIGGIDASQSPNLNILLEDGVAKKMVRGMVDDGSDDSVVSRAIAKQGVLNGLGRITKINPIKINVALTKGVESETFTFSKQWTFFVQRYIWHRDGWH